MLPSPLLCLLGALACLAPPLSSAAARLSRSGYNVSPLPSATVKRLAAELTPDQRWVTLQKGTERPFKNEYHDNHADGVYVCVLGGLPLFDSRDKYESGTGWPSFFRPYDPEHVREVEDSGWLMTRTEVVDARSGAHLGHVFDDGPPPYREALLHELGRSQIHPKG